jgi:hypothetical protein
VLANIFMVNEPLRGKQYVKVTERKTKNDWAHLIKEITTDRLIKKRMRKSNPLEIAQKVVHFQCDNQIQRCTKVVKKN